LRFRTRLLRTPSRSSARREPDTSRRIPLSNYGSRKVTFQHLIYSNAVKASALTLEARCCRLDEREEVSPTFSI
jgi:hypothetical protein